MALCVLASDLVGTWAVWGRAPTDTLRVVEPVFWPFALPRLAFCGTAVMIALAARQRIGKERTLSNVQAVPIAVGVETVATAAFWTSPSSARLRLHYEGMARWRWYGKYADTGAVIGYFVDHCVGVITLLCLTAIPATVAIVAWRLVKQYRRDASAGLSIHAGRPEGGHHDGGRG